MDEKKTSFVSSGRLALNLKAPHGKGSVLATKGSTQGRGGGLAAKGSGNTQVRGGGLPTKAVKTHKVEAIS